MLQCINLDWLEIFCNEDPAYPLTPEYFQRQGWNVKRRAYGTRQYNQMFTLCWGEFGVYEIRRDPLSKKSQGGIFADTACHIRLCNRQLYCPKPINQLVNLLQFNHIHFKSISRFDLCKDFYKFDTKHENPKDFISAYMKGLYSKIHQSRLSAYGLEKNAPDNVPTWDVAAHGEDSWDCRSWNSLKWGSPTSLVSTKLYNKSMELRREGHDKPYIRDQWRACGFPEGTDVWRVEFSIHAGKRHQIERSSGRYQEIRLEQLSTPELLQMQFYSFYAEYFHFKVKEYTRNGTPKRKDLCSSVVFFENQQEAIFEPTTITKKHDTTRTDRLLIKRLREIINESEDYQINVKESCAKIIEYISYNSRNHGITPEEIEAIWARIDELHDLEPWYLTMER